MSEDIFDSDSLAKFARRFAPLIFGAGALAGGALGLDLPDWAEDALRQWGPAAALMLLIVWYIPRSLVVDFITAQQKQAVALNAVAESIKNLPQRDHMKFEEILIGQEMLNRSLDRVHQRLDAALGERQHGQG